jgi:hypothetical protein
LRHKGIGLGDIIKFEGNLGMWSLLRREAAWTLYEMWLGCHGNRGQMTMYYNGDGQTQNNLVFLRLSVYIVVGWSKLLHEVERRELTCRLYLVDFIVRNEKRHFNRMQQ